MFIETYFARLFNLNANIFQHCFHFLWKDRLKYKKQEFKKICFPKKKRSFFFSQTYDFFKILSKFFHIRFCSQIKIKIAQNFSQIPSINQLRFYYDVAIFSYNNQTITLLLGDSNNFVVKAHASLKIATFVETRKTYFEKLCKRFIFKTSLESSLKFMYTPKLFDSFRDFPLETLVLYVFFRKVKGKKVLYNTPYFSDFVYNFFIFPPYSYCNFSKKKKSLFVLTSYKSKGYIYIYINISYFISFFSF